METPNKKGHRGPYLKKKSVDFANLDTSEFDHTETLPHSRYGNANVCNENYVSFQILTKQTLIHRTRNTVRP